MQSNSRKLKPTTIEREFDDPAFASLDWRTKIHDHNRRNTYNIRDDFVSLFRYQDLKIEALDEGEKKKKKTEKVREKILLFRSRGFLKSSSLCGCRGERMNTAVVVHGNFFS